MLVNADALKQAGMGAAEGRHRGPGIAPPSAAMPVSFYLGAARFFPCGFSPLVVYPTRGDGKPLWPSGPRKEKPVTTTTQSGRHKWLLMFGLAVCALFVLAGANNVSAQSCSSVCTPHTSCSTACLINGANGGWTTCGTYGRCGPPATATVTATSTAAPRHAAVVPTATPAAPVRAAEAKAQSAQHANAAPNRGDKAAAGSGKASRKAEPAYSRADAAREARRPAA
jgi:hypothetical protein